MLNFFWILYQILSMLIRIRLFNLQYQPFPWVESQKVTRKKKVSKKLY